MANILVVDDRSINREVLSVLFDETNHHIQEAVDGVEALEFIKHQIPDLIIADIAMPRMNGISLVTELLSKEAYSRIPVIFYSAAYRTEESHYLANAPNVKYILTKPCKPEIILQCVHEVLSEPKLLNNTHYRKKDKIDNINLRLTNLIEIGLDMSQEYDLDKLIYIMCKAGRQFLNANYAGIILADNHLSENYIDDNQQDIRSYTNIYINQENKIKNCNIDVNILSDSINHIFIKETICCLYSPIINLNEIGLTEISLPFSNLLCIPIKTVRRYYGKIYFINKTPSQHFTLSDQRFMMTLADKFAINYENLILYKKVEQHSKDLEKEVKAEEKLRLYRKKMAEVGRSSSLGELASSLAHEINQPLAAIAAYVKGCIKRIEKENQITPAIIEILHETALQAERAGEIVHRIKSFVRKGELFYEAIDINYLLDEVIYIMKQEAQDYPIQIQCNKDKNFPKIEIDKIQIQQVLLNLLRNAMEAMQSVNTQNPEIQIKVAKLNSQRISIRITDNGPGFNEHVANNLFEPYFSTKPQGMGLGLAICRSIIEAHSGQLTGKALIGGGSTFEFDLPTQKSNVNSCSKIPA